MQSAVMGVARFRRSGLALRRACSWQHACCHKPHRASKAPSQLAAEPIRAAKLLVLLPCNCWQAHLHLGLHCRRDPALPQVDLPNRSNNTEHLLTLQLQVAVASGPHGAPLLLRCCEVLERALEQECLAKLGASGFPGCSLATR